MRRHPPSNNSRGPARPNPLLLCGLALLLFALWRVYSAHGDLHELHESLNKPPGAAAARPPADVQVIMQEDEDVLFRNATSKPLNVIVAYPHVDECRQCSVCVPQSYIDQRLGNSSSRRGWWGRLWARRLLDTDQQQQQQHGQLLQEQEQQAELLPDSSSSSGGSANSGSNAGSRGRRRRHSWLLRQQQWLAALVSGLEAANSSRNTQPPLQLRQDHHHQQQQQQQQGWRRRQLLQQQQQRRPRLDGVKTHKAWLAKQAAGVANTDTHTVPGIQVILHMPDNSFSWRGSRYHIGPSSLQMDQRKIRHCKVCRGCRDLLTPMPKGIHWLGGSYLHDPGASDGWLSTAASPAGSNSQAVVKVWCTPVPKPGSRVPAVCKPAAIREQLQLLLALQNIAEDCHLGELLPHTWIGPVDGILPGSHGYRVHWDGLWSHLEVGVSAENLGHRGDPRAQPGLLLDYLQHKLNSTQVILAAVFDLLFSQCDRHGQNLYLKPDGSLVLIDNDQSYGASWRPCGVDSLFLPGTQKFEVERLGYSYVMKKPEYAPPKSPRSNQVDPLQLLDYRCHLPPGQTSLGTLYPKPVQSCLKRLAKMDPDRIAAKYGYPHPRMAAAVHQRAQDMLAKGFEWTLQNGWPCNPLPMRYKWAKGCCQMRRRQQDSSSSGGGSSDAAAAGSSSSGSSSGTGPAGDEGAYECTRWVQEDLGWPTDLPAGDPVSGMAWEHNGVDSGSYSLTNEWDPVADPAQQQQQQPAATAAGF